MPQVKIHVSNSVEGLTKGRLAIEVSETMSRYADINDGILQVMVYESKYRISEYNNTNNFVLIEILTSKERTVEEKQWLANLLIDKVEKLTNINSDDITVIYNDVENIKYFGVGKKVEEDKKVEENNKNENDNLNTLFTLQEEKSKFEGSIINENTVVLSTKNETYDVMSDKCEINLINEESTIKSMGTQELDDLNISMNSLESNNKVEFMSSINDIEEGCYEGTEGYEKNSSDEKNIYDNNDIDNTHDYTLINNEYYNMEDSANNNELLKYEVEEQDNNDNEEEEVIDNLRKDNLVNSNNDNGTFELLYQSNKGVFNITQTKILDF